MDAWFEYVLGLSELVYNMKLHEYEDACASLVLTAAGVAASAVAAAEAESNKAPCAVRDGGAPALSEASAALAPSGQAGSTELSPAYSVGASMSNASTPPTSIVAASARSRSDTSASASAKLAGTQHCSLDQGETTTSTSSLPACTDRPTATASAAGAAAPTPTAAAVMGPRCNTPTTTAAGALVSPAETVGALLDAMLIRKPMRAATLRSQPIDDIQSEADVVFRELDDVFLLQPGDAAVATAAAAVTAAASSGRGSPQPSAHPSSVPLTRRGGESADAFPAAPPGSLPVSPPPPGTDTTAAATAERQLLYGELTSVGVRQLQAISMAATCVVHEEHRRSHSRDHHPSHHSHHPHSAIAGNASVSMAGSFGGSATPGFGFTPPVPRNVSAPLLQSLGHPPCGAAGPRRAVVVAVDVGSGNGRLLFEWARLAAAVCRRRPEHGRRRPTEVVSTSTAAAAVAAAAGMPATLTSPQSTISSAGSTTSAGGAHTYAAVARRGNLLAAAAAPLGIACPDAVWRGWVGVGIELVPSRMRIARKALVPHYLNLKPTLLVPTAGSGLQPAPTHLDPCPPEAIAVSAMSASYSASTSLQSGCLSQNTTATASMTGSPVSQGAACRLPQPAARVLLYEGDALTPGVLSNATLCRFPNLGHHGEPLLLRESCTGHEVLLGLTGGNGVGGEGGCGAGGSTFPYAGSASLGASASASAALNNSYLLNSTRPGGHHGRRGQQTPLAMSLASATSNASSLCSTRGGSAKQNYYRLCRVEGGPSLMGREDPHLVVFCCALGFEEAQVRRLCQRLEDILLRRPAQYTEATTPVSTRPGSEDEVAAAENPLQGSQHQGQLRRHSPGHHHRRHNSSSREHHRDSRGSPSMSSFDGENAEDELEAHFAVRPSTPTTSDPAIGLATALGGGFASQRHWESVTCVLLLRPMDVLPPSFPLFRYASRVYETQSQPVPPEDTALLLSTGYRSDGTAVPYSTRATPATGCAPGSSVGCDLVESDVWTTTLETTWMNAAPAWVVRFHF